MPFITLGDTITVLIPGEWAELTGWVVEWSGGETKKGEIIRISLDTPQTNIMDHIIKPNKLRRNTRKVETPVARAKGGFGYVRIWWSDNADYYLVQRTQAPVTESSWRNTGGQVKGKTYSLRVPLLERVHLRVAAVKGKYISSWSNVVSAKSIPFQTIVDETGETVIDVAKKYLNGFHVNDKYGKGILNPETRIININKMADKDGRIVLNTTTNEIFGVDIRDLGGNPVIDVGNKEAFGLHLKDSKNNTILNPVDKKLKGVSVVDA